MKQPPKIADRFLRFYCRKDKLEDLQGDLYEFYERNNEKNGEKWADFIYWIDVLKFLRLYTVKKPKINRSMNTLQLFQNYFKTSIRSIARNRLFSGINIVGLSISMSVGVIMILYLGELLSYDTFHEKKSRIYRVINTFQAINDDEPGLYASTSVLAGKKIREQIPGVEKVLLMRRNFNEDLSKGDRVISVSGLYASEEFFDVFSFSVLHGNPREALVDPNALVLTRTVANKLFDQENAVGQIVQGVKRTFTVSAVVADPPSNSHINFEALTSFATIENEKKKEGNDYFFSWRSMWQNYVYLLLPEGQDPAGIEESMASIAKSENSKSDRYWITLSLEPLSEIVPGKDLSNQLGPSVTWDMIYALGALTLIVILSACFNYTNLSIARSLRRSKEVGVRKIVGATRGQVFVQFLFEAAIIASFALIIGFGFALLLRPHFIQIIVEGGNASLPVSWEYVFYFLLFATFIGVLAGGLPSAFLSKLEAISILRDSSKIRLFKGVNLRRVLIVFQFTLSMGFIIGTTISYRQYQYSLNFDLGFATESILNLRLQGNDVELVRNELEKLSGVNNMSSSGMVMGVGEVWTDRFKYQDPLDSFEVFVNYVDKEFLNVHDIQLTAGSNFAYNLKKDDKSQHLVVDQKFAKRIGYDNPADAVGEVVIISRRSGQTKLEIVGVTEDFYYAKIEAKQRPTAFILGEPTDFTFMNLAIQTTDILSLMDRLDQTWRSVDKVHPLRAQFYDDRIDDAYSSYATTFKMLGFLAVLAVSIASLGLLGMAVFTTESRLKEISVRKVLGATEQSLVYLLSRGFLYMLLLSALLALPLTYLFFTGVVFEGQENRINIGPLELLPGVLGILVLGAITIGWQVINASRTNPAETLRSE